MNRCMASYFSKAEPVPDTAGNLYEPPEDDGAVDGGFRRPDQRRKVGIAAGAIALAGVVAAATLLARRSNDAT
jgi:hypothetical protein